MAWTKVYFGKHEGKTLPQIVFNDPDYFFWARDEDAFVGKGPLEIEFNDVLRKARRIRIPDNVEDEKVVEYVIFKGEFYRADVVLKSQPEHTGSSKTIRSKYFDLSVPRQLVPYDKLGCKNLVTNIKSHVFGDAKAKMTKKRVESFFEDETNFDL